MEGSENSDTQLDNQTKAGIRNFRHLRRIQGSENSDTLYRGIRKLRYSANQTNRGIRNFRHLKLRGQKIQILSIEGLENSANRKASEILIETCTQDQKFCQTPETTTDCATFMRISRDFTITFHITSLAFNFQQRSASNTSMLA